MKPVKIKVSSSNKSRWQDQAEKLEVVSFGRLAEKNGKYYVLYDETEASGLAGTKTTIKWEKQRVVVIRTGKVEHRQEFAPGFSSHSLYQTPYLTIPMETVTSSVHIGGSGSSWKIDLEYDLFYDAQDGNHINLSIEIEEDKQGEYQGYTGQEY